MSKDVFKAVRAIIVEHLCVPMADVTLHAQLEEDLGADSLDLVTIALSCEEAFAIPDISDTESEQLVTVGDLVELVKRKLESTDA